MYIEIVDDQPPEAVAMLQALYSRSPRSVREHLVKVREKGAANFMADYYVGYGHKSIGDCGSTSVFIEDVSMLAAKAVQDHPLYSGQEASTRYLDMTTRPMVDPLSNGESGELQQAWMKLYSEALAAVIEELKRRHPRKDDEKETAWTKAVKARAFDICRSLLPAGCTTLVAWHSNLRQLHDHGKELRNHPLAEIREMMSAVYAALRTRYPSSFGHTDRPEEEAYIRASMDRFAYYFPNNHPKEFLANWDLDGLGLAHESTLLRTRPPRTELHQRFRQYGSITFRDRLDFGSFRDLQRQRSAVQEMPLLTTRLGFHHWYLEQLPSWVRSAITTLEARVNALVCSEIVRQYYIPMGYLVPVVLNCSLPSAVYIAELRSGQTVHSTLRIMAQKMGNSLKQAVGGMAMHHDTGPDEWSIKRGHQDIVEKK